MSCWGHAGGEDARGGSSHSSDEDMASYDGDIDCRSDEDEDDGRSPVYATRSSAHGVKEPTVTGNDIAVIYPILRPRLTSLSQLLHRRKQAFVLTRLCYFVLGTSLTCPPTQTHQDAFLYSGSWERYG